MRKEIKTIDRPSLTMHIDYDHLTVGELGNILIRLQAALRSIAGLSPGEYDRRYSAGQPRFITSSVSTKQSIDITLLLAVLAVALQTPGAINDWRIFSTEVFRRFKIAVTAMVRGDIKAPETAEKLGVLEHERVEILQPEGGAESLKVVVTRGKIDLEASRPFLDELTPMQRRRLANFLWSLTGPTRRVNVGDDESEISMHWSNEEKDT